MDGTRLAQDVLAFLSEGGVQIPEDLEQAETVIREGLLRIGATALELHLNARKLGYEGPARACPCGRVQRFVGHRAKTFATLLGSASIRRAYYHCEQCGAGCFPYDEQAGLGQSQVSVALAKVATRLGVLDPFATDAELLYWSTGQRLSAATVRRLTEQVGAVAAAEESALAAGVSRWEPPEAEVLPERLYVAVDGVMVPEKDGFHEAKTVTCYWENEKGERGARYAVRFEEAAAFAAYVWVLACRCGQMTAKEVVLLGDGARWIWEHIAPVLERPICVVDWYHAMEHVWACGRSLYGEGTEETRAWVKEMEGLLWEGQVASLLTRLREQRATARAPAKRKALESLMTYLKNQGDRLAYDRFRERGWDIGSGRVEAACKNVVALRMKRSGMRWSRSGAQTTLSLRAVNLSQDWEAFWARKPLAA